MSKIRSITWVAFALSSGGFVMGLMGVQLGWAIALSVAGVIVAIAGLLSA